ncbi:MAG: hypothetical protein JXO51_05355 [Candidatus Aminicenantes bacterium]|nr:hypothetical protein [Candidatus Aminicenantes bacterium]
MADQAKKRRRAWLSAMVLFATAAVGCAFASAPGDGDEQDEGISTVIQDAEWEVPFLDRFQPLGAQPLAVLPKHRDGVYQLNKPGYYLFESQSYCLNPGKYTPGDETGYLVAPMKGPKAPIIMNILRRASRHPEITQEQIQTLIWAIVSHSEISLRSGELYSVAKKLMSGEELLEANRGVAKKIAKAIWERMIQRMPPPLQRVLEAQARIRDLILDAQSSYEDLVAAAVLEGEPPPAPGSRDVPRSRWSFHPDGYFIRLDPRGFSALLIELYLPGDIQVEVDPVERIVSLRDERGNMIKTAYQEVAIQESAGRDPGLKKHHFSSVEFRIPDPDNTGKILTRKWTANGWTLCGDSLPATRDAAAGRRLEKTRRHQAEFNHLLRTGPRDDAQIRDLWRSAGARRSMNLIHYYFALADILQADIPAEDDGWEWGHLNLVLGAWAHSLCQLAVLPDYAGFGLALRLAPGGGGCGSASSGGATFDPCGVTGAGGNAGMQAVAASGAGTEDNDDCARQFEEDSQAAVDEHLECAAACPMVDPDHPEERVFHEMCLEECLTTMMHDLKEISDAFKDCMGLE